MFISANFPAKFIVDNHTHSFINKGAKKGALELCNVIFQWMEKHFCKENVWRWNFNIHYLDKNIVTPAYYITRDFIDTAFKLLYDECHFKSLLLNCMSSGAHHIINFIFLSLSHRNLFLITFLCLQVRTLFVSGLPLDIKPRELYLLFRPFKVSYSPFSTHCRFSTTLILH